MIFSDLATLAALGTGQRPLRPAELPEPLQALLEPGSDAPRQLLDAAAGWVTLRRSSIAEGPAVEDFAEADEVHAEASPALAATISRILDLTDHDQLLAETFSALRAAGLRLPHRLIVPSLAAVQASATPGLREQVLTAIGARGRWLLANQPQLLEQTTVANPSDWDGPQAARVAWLVQLNSTDSAGAVALLAESWKRESAKDRAEFLSVFASSPSPDQLDFLEAALGDRSERVIEVARAGLQKMPESPWRERMRGYASGLQITSKGIVFSQPQGDPQATRDGASGDSARTQILAAVPPADWPAIIGVGAEELIEAAGAQRSVLAAIGTAAVRAGDQATCRAVLARLGDGAGRALADQLLGCVDVGTRFALARRGDSQTQAIAALASLPRPWLEPAVAVALSHLPTWRTALGALPDEFIGLLERCVPPQLARRTAEALALVEPRDKDDRLRDIRRITTVLTLRAAVWDEVGPKLENR